jgi:hypothetical protein
MLTVMPIPHFAAGSSMRRLIEVAILVALSAVPIFGATATGPLRVNPANGRYFTDGTGRAIYLTGSHNWGNLRGFSHGGTLDWNAYLGWMQARNHNFIRLWAKEIIDGSPIPYRRTGPGNANIGGLKVNLDQFDQAYFDRIRQRCIDAGNRGMYVAIMLFQGWDIEIKSPGANNPWPNNMYHVNNNVQGINGDLNGDGQGREVHELKVAAVTSRQEAYVRKVIDTVNDLNNVLYEIANESHTASAQWQYRMIQVIRSHQATKAKQHPIGMTCLGYSYPLFTSEVLNNNALKASSADWISPFGGNNLDGYMDNPPAANGSKVIITDTDHIWGEGGDRKWVWKSFTRGLNTIFMDRIASLTHHSAGEISGTDENTRFNMGDTLTYANKMALVEMTPQNALSSTTYCLAKPGSEYLVYGLGGSFTVNLGSGSYSVEWRNPATRVTSTAAAVTGGRVATFTPPFSGDAVLYLRSSTTSNPPPSVTLTGPANGSSFITPANITLTATASDSNGTVSKVEFYRGGTTLIGTDNTSPYAFAWNNVAVGSYSIIAKATDNAGAATTSAAVTITVKAPTVNTPPSVTLTGPANGATFTAPASINLTATASDSNGTVSKVEFYRGGTTLIGTDTASPYTFAWTNVAVGSYSITAKATDNAGASTTSGAVAITVTAPPVNTPPTVTLTAPANGASFTTPANITLTATASDSNGTVSKVEFYRGGTTLIGTDSTSPYTFAWTNVAVGSYTVTAKATDNAGAATTSAAVTITVKAPTVNTPPTVTLTGPANGATFTAPASINLTATASDSNGTVSKVEFYRGGTTLIGTDTTSPYTFAWSNVAVGSYSVTAKATDNAGAATTSSAITITVATSLSNNAVVVSVSIPASMTVRQTYQASVAMRNSGTTTWTAAASYKLGSQNPQDNTRWGMNRVNLAAGEAIAPGQTKTFTFNVTAPATAGTYAFQWRMVQDGVAWFGGLSTNVSVTVSPDGGNSGSGTLNIAPEADVEISQLRPSMNHGSSTSLFVDGGPSGQVRRSFLRFNVSGLPAGAVVTDARIILVCMSPSKVTGGSIRKFQPTTAAWSEAGPTWDNPLAGSKASGLLATLGPVKTGSTYAFKNLASSISSNGRVTFKIRTKSTDAAGYYSNNHPTASQRPVLRISYTTAMAAPTGNG